MSTSHTPRRIVSLQPSVTVILAAVGELDRVVACTKYCADVVSEITATPRLVLHDSWTADASQITAAKPDFVIASVPYQEKAVIEILKSGARFLGLAPKTLADIYIDIATIAGTVGANARGEEVITAMRQHIDLVHSRVTNTTRPRVFCEEWGKPIIASQPWVAELIAAAGGTLISAPSRQISADEIKALDPEVFIASWCGAGDRVPLEKIIATRGWHEITAARTGRVFCIPDEFLNTPAPSLLHGLDALAYAIHPELFSRPKGIREITRVPSSTASKP